MPKVNVVFDTQALLILYLGERGAEQVASLLKEVLEGKINGFISIVNLAEVYYILCRRSRRVADEKESNLRRLGIRIVPVVDNALWREATILKTRHALSLADAFAVATAKALEATLVTGSDPEFESVDVEIERIGK